MASSIAIDDAQFYLGTVNFQRYVIYLLFNALLSKISLVKLE